jgi:DNA-directed RNA polymerase specialized sigma24 family protein
MKRSLEQAVEDFDRGRKAQKRGGGKRPVGLDVERDAVATSSDEAAVAATGDEAALAGLHEGLLCMAKEEPALFQILHLRFQQGMTLEQISAALAVPPSTLKRRHGEGLEWLRRKVEGTATPEEPD